jgi:hypothetical protein
MLFFFNFSVKQVAFYFKMRVVYSSETSLTFTIRRGVTLQEFEFPPAAMWERHIANRLLVFPIAVNQWCVMIRNDVQNLEGEDVQFPDIFYSSTRYTFPVLH